MMSARIAILGLVTSATLAGCATTTRYVPMEAEPVAASRTSFPVSRYSIPEDSPEGTIQVTSFGVVPIEPTGGGKASTALHVRIILSNEEGRPGWRVDTRQLLVSLNGEGESRPAFVNTDGTPPIITVPRGGERTLDLFYPLPADLARAQDVSSFTLRWTLVTASGSITRRTPLEQESVALEPPPFSSTSSEEVYASPSVYYEDYGWSQPYLSIGFGTYPYWYYDPLYPTYTFWSVPPIVTYHRQIVNAPRPVTVARPPAMGIPPVGRPPAGGSAAPIHIGRPPSLSAPVLPRTGPMPSVGPSRPAPMPAPSHIAHPPGPRAMPAPAPMHAPMPAPMPAPPPVHIARPPR